MKKGFFVTGTDTDVGKTWASVALMHYFKQQNLSVIGMKPVAAGCEWHQGQLKNEDALLLQQHASFPVPYSKINPYAYELPISPHLAAKDSPVIIEVIKNHFNDLKDQADVLIVEGAGGWLVPLNQQMDIADLANELQLPIIMIVAIKLGCINHSRLTHAAIEASGLTCAGWIAMCVESEATMQDEVIATITDKTTAPLLGVMPFLKVMDVDVLVSRISL